MNSSDSRLATSIERMVDKLRGHLVCSNYLSGLSFDLERLVVRTHTATLGRPKQERERDLAIARVRKGTGSHSSIGFGRGREK